MNRNRRVLPLRCECEDCKQQRDNYIAHRCNSATRSNVHVCNMLPVSMEIAHTRISPHLFWIHLFQSLMIYIVEGPAFNNGCGMLIYILLSYILVSSSAVLFQHLKRIVLPCPTLNEQEGNGKSMRTLHSCGVDVLCFATLTYRWCNDGVRSRGE